MKETLGVNKAAIDRMTRELVDAGKIVEAGFVGLRLMAIPPDAPAQQVDEMRNAFFAGAHHIYASMISMLDPGEEITDREIDRMGLIEAELDHFIKDFEKRHAI